MPALGALVAEPLFLLADSAVVGHLGTADLAALAVAGTAVTTMVNVCVFLAYGTTASVARLVGAGRPREAVRRGIDGLWLAGMVGLALLVAGTLGATGIVRLFGASAAVAPYGVIYLRISMLGVPAMLLVLAATGVLRGFQDTRTPLVVAVTGALTNIAANVILVYPIGLGIAGSAIGTVLVQNGMAAAYLAIVVRGARARGVGLRPDWSGVRAGACAGVPLIVRTMSFRAVLVVGTAVATRLGDVALAAHQVASTVWSSLAMVLDAVAIAGQAIVGRCLGASDIAGARAATRRMVQWGTAAGVVTGVVLIVARPLYVPLFTPDPRVRAVLGGTMIVVALLQPAAGAVFALDGVLIGAGDGRYLAWGAVLAMVAFVPVAVVVERAHADLRVLWVAMALFMAARLVWLWARYRRDRWLVVGAVRT